MVAGGPIWEISDIYQGTKSGTKQVYYGRHELLNEVNGTSLDPEAHPKYYINYMGGAFSKAGMNIEFHDSGSIKKFGSTLTSGMANALSSGAEVVDLPEDIEDAEVKRLKREKEKLQFEKEISELKGE